MEWCEKHRRERINFTVCRDCHADLIIRLEALEKWGRDMADCIPLASEPFLPFSEVGKRLDWLYNKAHTLGLVEE